MLRRAALYLSLFALSACNAPHGAAAVPHAATSAAAAAIAPNAPGVGRVPAAAGDTYADAPYARVRGALLAAGWLPLRTPDCRSNVGGKALVCNALPETDSCSGDGHCLMRFANAATSQQLTLHVDGDASRWNTAGGDFIVTSSETAALPRAPSAACPAKDFDGFLRAFAATPAARAAFTAPMVRTGELHSDDDGDRIVPVAYAAADYTGFNLTYDGRAYHHVDADGGVDPAPLAVDVADDARGATARYAYGASEGRAYRFERTGECWRLIEELPPALD